MTQVNARDRYMPRPLDKGRRGRHGAWVVPRLGASGQAHSGQRYVTNKWGDTSMGIGFPEPVDVHGAYFAGQSAKGAWTTGVQVVGYRRGEEVQRTDWFRDVGSEPTWFAMNLKEVDRIVIVATPVIKGGGWYALDDLTYSLRQPAERGGPKKVVVDFEDLPYRFNLTDSGYADLTWETGAGDFSADQGIHAPQVPPGVEEDVEPEGDRSAVVSGTRATEPTFVTSFQGVVRGDAGSWTFPPDTDGAVGPNHYVITVNRNFAVYDKTSHAQIVDMTLGAFLPGSNGDPRVLFDHHSGRWVVIVSDFDTRIYLAVSLTDDPTGSWYKTSILVSQGSDAGLWPDYPTLGVDAYGIYTAAYMAGGASTRMSIFAIDKAPLVAPSPSLGTVTAFRGLPWEEAIQPAHTYGVPAGEYCVSIKDSNELRIRRVNPPLTSPTLTDLGTVGVPRFYSPPDAPALGSVTDLDTVGRRLMMSVYRDGSLWTCHTVSVNGRAACNWYEIDAATLTLVQSGTAADNSLYFYFPSIMVNQLGSAVMAFTGSNANQYAACYYVGRHHADPLGDMSAPVRYKVGAGMQNNIDDYGRNRWGDYSYTTLDPTDETTFWTIQEYGHATDLWGTYVAVLNMGDLDCNTNGVPDWQDIDEGTSQDCNLNTFPDECDLARGASLDCNTNDVPDECDTAGGTSPDCNDNSVPDECELAEHDCNGNSVPDDCDIAAGTSLDCNNSGIPDDCELAGGASPDCNDNSVPDECDVAIGTSPDCNDNGVPDECDLAGVTSADCNANGTPDECDIAAGTSLDCNYNGVPDSCDLAGGTSPDCNSNSLPDECELLTEIMDASGQLTPLGDGFPQTHTLHSPPPAFGPVTLAFQAYGDLNFSSEYVDVYVNDEWVDAVFNGDVTAFDCPETPDADETVVSAALWNVAAATSTVEIRMVTTSNVDPIACTSPTWISVTVTYPTESMAADCNENGTLDECDIAAGTSPDCNTNGIPDECDIAAGTSADADSNGIPDECDAPPEWCLGDMNCSGGIAEFTDINYFVAAIGNESGWWQYYRDSHGGEDPPCYWLMGDYPGTPTGVEFQDIVPFANGIGQPCVAYTP